MNTIMKTKRSVREKVMFGLSVLLFALLNLVPGFITRGSYAEAQSGGGGGGGASCPGSRCTGQTQPVCCTIVAQQCDTGHPPVCVTVTNYYYFP